MTETTKSDIPQVGARSPWGTVKTVTRNARGIATVTTCGHGGIKLAADLNRKVNPTWRKKGGWYEEDCEYAIVVLTFPEAFPGMVEEAHTSAKNNFPHEYGAVYSCTVKPEESRALRVEQAKEAAKGKYQANACWGSWANWVPEGFVGVCARIDGLSHTERYFLVPETDYQERAPNTIWVIDPNVYSQAPCNEMGNPVPIK